MNLEGLLVSEAVVVTHGIRKSFGPTQALSDVSLELWPGEVRALVGENGAGKTTLMNILYGMFPPDAGTIDVWGRRVGDGWCPRAAIRAGIGMVHQHFSLVPAHTVLENVVMPMLGWSDVFPEWKRHADRIEDLCSQYGFLLKPHWKVGQLSVGQQQQVEILKALYQGVRFLILDEPTAVLTPQESEQLFAFLAVLRGQGKTVVLITHKLYEAWAVSDRITVLQGGHHVATVERDQATPSQIAAMMIKHEPQQVPTRVLTGRDSCNPLLAVTNLVISEASDQPLVDGVSLEIAEGEILGIAGVAGNGQTELAEALVGLRKATSGSMKIYEQEIASLGLGTRRRELGLGFIPEDKQIHGLVLQMAVAENLILDMLDSQPFSWRGILRRRAVNAAAKKLIEDYRIRTPGSDCPARRLSGGNQQKIILARTLSAQPKVIVACQPTRGLDFSSTEYVHHKLVEAAAKGVAVLLISSDLDELIGLSHRIAVMYRGRIVGTLARQAFDLRTIGQMMLAGHQEPSCS
jgi:simple sugar transport system ATP-binding protein